MNSAATIALAPLGLLYGAAVATRSAMYRRGIFRKHKVPAPVISVGNITTGGTGKSPLVAWIARELAHRGRKVGILTRGYGRSNSQQRIVATDGKVVSADVAQAGDEPLMLAEALRGVAAVICDANRVAAANWAIDNLKSDVLILDDGFQHLRIARDLDIVTVDATNPFGNGRLLPAGILREPIDSLGRAGCIVLTRTTTTEPIDLRQRLQELSGAPVFKSQTVVKAVRSFDSADVIDREFWRTKAVAAFCGIGNPAAFFQQLRAEGYDLRHSATFRDHHVYAQSDIDKLSAEASERGAQALITTAKDAVKLRTLRFALPCYVVEIELRIAQADQLVNLIEKAIARRADH